MILRRLLLRGAVAIAVLLAHRAVGGWLVGLDPLAELLSGDRLLVGAALVLLVPLRLAAWFGVVPWVAAGTAADLADARAERADRPTGTRVHRAP